MCWNFVAMAGRLSLWPPVAQLAGQLTGNTSSWLGSIWPAGWPRVNRRSPKKTNKQNGKKKLLIFNFYCLLKTIKKKQKHGNTMIFLFSFFCFFGNRLFTLGQPAGQRLTSQLASQPPASQPADQRTSQQPASQPAWQPATHQPASQPAGQLATSQTSVQQGVSRNPCGNL